jgi:hypothetical protein
MKKLFLAIGVIALIIVLIAGVLALLSLFNLVPFFSDIVVNDATSFPEDQVTILVASVDTLSKPKFVVQEMWLVYVVTSRMDTAIIQEAHQTKLESPRIRKAIDERKLVQLVESEENLHVDYVFFIDEIGSKLINDLLENQQSSINRDNSIEFCEILTSNELQMFDLYLQYAQDHVYHTLPESLIQQFAVSLNIKDSLYCESIEP